MAKAGAAEKKLREICLAFPEAVEKETWGHPTFRVKDKIFVGCGEDDDGRYTMSLKAEPGMQDALLGEGAPFYYPKYVGSKGWVGVYLDGKDGKVDWGRIADLVDDSFRAIAPKRLVNQLDGP